MGYADLLLMLLSERMGCIIETKYAGTKVLLTQLAERLCSKLKVCLC